MVLPMFCLLGKGAFNPTVSRNAGDVCPAFMCSGRDLKIYSSPIVPIALSVTRITTVVTAYSGAL
jgi:hypothetical protein